MATRVWPFLSLAGAWSGTSARNRMPESTGFLLLEADRDRAQRLVRALQSPCTLFEHGNEAMSYLLGHAPFSDRAKHPLPQAILVDLEHPRHSGLELLQWTRLTPSLRLIPVIVLKNAFSAADLQEAYTAGAVSCIEYPADELAAARVAEGLKRYWLGCNLPPYPKPRKHPEPVSDSENSQHGS